MNRLTFFVDIAGRASLDVLGSPRVTAAAIVFGSRNVDSVRHKLPNALPKWKDCTASDAEAVIDLVVKESIAVGVFSINKDTASWRELWKDAEPLQNAIIAQDKRPAGFVKPANVLVFYLIGASCAVGGGHALRIGPKNRIQNHRGLDLIDRTIICDSEVSGAENLQVFRHLWDRADGWQPRLEQAGIQMTTADVRVTSEEQEPLLLLADYVAGISHASLLSEPGRLKLPLSFSDAGDLINRIRGSGKLAFHSADFDLKYGDIFGDAITATKASKLS